MVAGQWQQTLEGHSKSVRQIAFCPDGKTLASGGDDGKVVLWDTSTWQPRQELQGHSKRVWGLAFSPDGTILAWADNNQKILLWESGRQRVLHNGFASNSWRGHPTKLVFSPDGRSLASGREGMLQVWDVATGTRRTPPNQVQADGPVRSVAFSTDGSTLIFAQGNGATSVDLVTGQESRFVEGQTSPTSSLAVSGDRRTIAVGTREGQVLVWDGVAGRRRHTIPACPSQEVYATAISPDGQTIASAGDDRRIALWDATTGVERQTLAKDQLACALAFSVDGSRLAAYCFDGSVRLFDLAQGEEAPVVPDQFALWGSVVFSPDGKIYGAMSAEVASAHVLRIHDARNGEELRRVELPIPAGSGARALGYNPDGSLLAAATNLATVFLFETRSWKTVKQFQLGPMRGEINGVSFSPDGRYLATANGNGTVYVLRVDAAALRDAASKVENKPKAPSGS